MLRLNRTIVALGLGGFILFYRMRSENNGSQSMSDGDRDRALKPSTRTRTPEEEKQRKAKQRKYWAQTKAHTVCTPLLKSPDGKALSWWVVDDVVMGGRSHSELSVSAEGGLSFQGVCSTVGGGFCSARANIGVGSMDASNNAVAITASGGDGRQYKVTLQVTDELELSGGKRSPAWQAVFTPNEDGSRTRAVLPFTSFSARWHGRPLPQVTAKGLSPGSVKSVGVQISHVRGANRDMHGDGDHPFGLSVDSIEWLTA